MDQKGAVVNGVDERGWSALHYAAFNNRCSFLDELRRKGAG